MPQHTGSGCQNTAYPQIREQYTRTFQIQSDRYNYDKQGNHQRTETPRLQRVDIDTDSRAAKTFYTYRGGLHINGTGNLSFHIVPPQDSLGLGRFAICATRNGESSQLGTDHAPFFFRWLFAFLKGERKEKEIIEEICTDRRTE